MKVLLGAITAAVIAGVAFVQPAEARCFWNGFETVCVRHMDRDFDRPYHRDFDRPYYRDFDRPHWGGYGWDR